MDIKLEDLAEKARKIASEIPDSEDWEHMRKMASTLGEETAVFVRKYPLQSVLGAAALGFVLGSMVGRRK